MESLQRLYRNGLYAFKGIYGFLEVKIYFLVKILNPILQVLFFSMIAAHAYQGQDITPYIIGNAFVLCSSNAFFGAGCTLIAERSYGTLKNIIAAPYNKFGIFVSKAMFHVLDGGLTVAVGIVAGVVFLGLRIPVECIPKFILIVAVAMFTACAMGLLIGSIGLITRDINLLLNVASMLLMALSGVNFPVDRLPMALQYVSKALPLTHALEASRNLMHLGSEASGAINGLIAREFIIGIIYCMAAYLLFKFMETMAKRRATIDIY